MAHDIRFIRLDDDLTDKLNREAEESHQRVSDLANALIRLQLYGRAEPLKSPAAGAHTDSDGNSQPA